MSFYPNREDDMDFNPMPLPLSGVGTPVFQLRNARYDPHGHLPVSTLGEGVSEIDRILHSRDRDFDCHALVSGFG